MPINIFLCYAHKDQRLRDGLAAHLGTLRRQGIIDGWYDGDIGPGREWEQQASDALAKANIILLLVSSDFLVLDFCYGEEMQKALDRHRKRQTWVVPIIVRPVDYEGSPISQLQMLPSGAKPVTRWKDHEEAWQNVLQGIREVIAHFDVPKASSVTMANQEPIWHIPYPRNPFFTGREALLKQLADAFFTKSASTVLPQPLLALCGIGGVGKTQIALEYAYRHRDKYQYTLWVSSDTREELISSFSSIAELLNLPEKDEKDQHLTVEAVKRWLERQSDWLLVLDNADELTLVNEFIPPRYRGHILLTTRASEVQATLAQTIMVETMPLEEGMLLLLRRAAIIGPTASLEEASEAEQRKASEIVREVGGLPLALDQAGAYIEETGCGFAGYLKLYQQQKYDLLNAHDRKSSLHSAATLSTWLRTFENIERTNEAAADLLRLCACLHPHAIPEEMITEGAAHLGHALASTATDALTWNRTCENLRAYSLLNRDVKSKTLTIPRLTQTLLRDEMDRAMQLTWIERAIKVVKQAFSSTDTDVRHWSQLERVLPHVLECAELSKQWNLMLTEVFPLLKSTAEYFTDRGRYKEAEALYLRVLETYQQFLGADYPGMQAIENNLATLQEIIYKSK